MWLKLAHTPDADDAFMFYALLKGKINTHGLKFKDYIADIETLNRKSLREIFDLTAISAAVYPLIQNKYEILDCGASVGRNYGPVLAGKNRIKNFKGIRIALPGKHTTASTLLKIFLQDFIPVYLPFEKTLTALLENRVEAALLIHEAQITYQRFGLMRLLDLAKIWAKKTKSPLLPLGLNVVRKSLNPEQKNIIYHLLHSSINYALKNPEEAFTYALEYARGTERKMLFKFVKMYVNRDTLSLGRKGKEALTKLFCLERKVGMPAVEKFNLLKF